MIARKSPLPSRCCFDWGLGAFSRYGVYVGFGVIFIQDYDQGGLRSLAPSRKEE